MSAKTDYLENKIIDWLFRGQAAPTLPAALHFALFTTAATDAGGQVEVSGGAYARAAVTRSLTNFAGTQGAGTTVASTGTSGTTSNNATILFAAPTANWGTVTSIGVFDAPTGGNMLLHGTLTTPKTISAGSDAPSFAVAEFTYQEDN